MLQNNQTSEIPSSLGELEDSGLGRRRSQQSWLSEDRGPEPRHNFTLIGRVHASPALRLAWADWLTWPRRVQTVGVAMGYRQLRGTPEIFRQELRQNKQKGQDESFLTLELALPFSLCSKRIYRSGTESRLQR